MEGGYSFLLQFTSNHFNEQKDCTLNELFQVYQEGSVLEEYKYEKCSVQSEAVETDKIVTLPSILCAVVSYNINHEGRPNLINSPVDYPVDELRCANITLDGHMNNDGHSYRLFGAINCKSTGSDTGPIPPYANQYIHVIGLNITMEMYGRVHSVNIMMDLRRHHINGWLQFSSMKKQAFWIATTCSANKLNPVCRAQRHPSGISLMQC
jgi:hypothetical protein